ncbi:PTS sugar transporter subunit IIC [Staphylococcus epidermidis]|uniref:PTS sugar transporter subunit IIC n=1 Tax=Staphylococcus epidermidis TaxID=1282 RepID=UPI00266BC6E5|nr:PTS sugar transporter subunit IIC [Staphylococcus epidermidis]MDO2946792.1 PTS sugar transporter subunit IIC [Staphylococcus epidermidis]
MAFIIGVVAAHQFKFKGTGAAIIGISAMLGSGAVHYNEQTIELKGIGDIIKCNFSSYVSLFHLYVFRSKLGSLEMIILPVLVPVISGLIGLLTLPYIQVITQSLGKLVNRFHRINPLLMSILICVTFFFING